MAAEWWACAECAPCCSFPNSVVVLIVICSATAHLAAAPALPINPPLPCPGPAAGGQPPDPPARPRGSAVRAQAAVARQAKCHPAGLQRAALHVAMAPALRSACLARHACACTVQRAGIPPAINPLRASSLCACQLVTGHVVIPSCSAQPRWLTAVKQAAAQRQTSASACSLLPAGRQRPPPARAVFCRSPAAIGMAGRAPGE